MRALKRKFNSNIFQIRRKKMNVYLFVFVFIAVLALLQIRHSATQKREIVRVDASSRAVTSPTDREDLGRTKLILVHSRLIWREPWVPLPEQADGYKFTDWDGTPCEEPRCQITYDRNLLNISDAVLVHGAAVKPSVEEMTRNRPPHQRWVFYVKESPATWACGRKGWDGLFNWTATYRRDSDFFVPYGSYVPLEVPRDAAMISHSSSGFNYAQGKDKMATFGVSNHCSRKRFAFVLALMKHIPVDVYGKCATQLDTNTTWHCPHKLNDGCIEELQRHKFYLAFENTYCIDYITEKYWRNSLERGLVPVVLGGASYDSSLAIPGSFINAANFHSVKALADYLKYLDKNDTAYNEYFEWRSKYKVVKYRFWLCRLCKALHDSKSPAKTYHKLSEFWGVEENCGLGNERVWDIINRGRERIKQR